MNAPVKDLAVIDPRLAFLARAAARHELVRLGELDIDDAIAGLIEPFEEMTGRLIIRNCPCNRELLERWERIAPPKRRGCR